jgi:hypothetical protein
MTVNVPLTKHEIAIVDDCDADLLTFRWHSTNGYAARNVTVDGVTARIFLHRAIMERLIDRPLNKGEYVDHINRNTLDNTRANLRVATPKQNMANSKSRNKTGLPKGVISVGNEKYRAQISSGGKIVLLGLYCTAYDASLAYDKAAFELHGEFAYLNNPDVTDYSHVESLKHQPRNMEIDALTARAQTDNVSEQSIIDRFVTDSGTAMKLARFLGTSRWSACMILQKRGYTFTRTGTGGYWTRATETEATE